MDDQKFVYNFSESNGRPIFHLIRNDLAILKLSPGTIRGRKVRRNILASHARILFSMAPLQGQLMLPINAVL